MFIIYIKENTLVEKERTYMYIMAVIQISATMSPELHDLCKEHKISWSEALRTGAAVILADKGVKDYDNNLNLYRKMRTYQQMTEKLSHDLKQMQEKLDG